MESKYLSYKECKDITSEGNMSVCYALAKAIEDESGAIETYAILKKQVPDEKGQKLMQHIMDEEKEHFKELKEYIREL